MDAGYALCIGVGANTGDHRSNASTDVLTHNDGRCHAVGNDAGSGQGLQNGNRCSGALDQRGKQRTHYNTHHRVLKADQHICKLGQISQTFHRVLHKVHAIHQNGKADEDGTDALFLIALGTHQHQNTDERNNGRKVFRLHHLNEQTAALQTGKAQDPSSEGGTDVGTKDHADGLSKLHNAGVDQTHQHNGNGRRRLHRNGDGCTQHQADDGVGGGLFQQLFQLAAGHLFQIGRHHVHAVQEKDQAKDQAQNIDFR